MEETDNNLFKKMARYEVGWWKDHHRKRWDELIKNMAQLYQLQFGIPEKNATECVKYRIDAAHEHDIAEKLEDGGKQKEADVLWDKAEELIARHFEILMKKQKGR